MLLAELDNLLENAAKYSEPGTHIIIDLGVKNDVVTLAVEDSGMGITEGKSGDIFEPFYRSPEARAGCAGHAPGALGRLTPGEGIWRSDRRDEPA